MSKSQITIGIDLGTTNSVVAMLEGNEPIILPTAEGSLLCPSVVSFSETGKGYVIGEVAKRQLIVNPDYTVSSIKRIIGTDETVTVGKDIYTPEQISAMILKKLKDDASEYIGEEVTQAVITVPAYFNDSQRQSTRDAGRIAGLNVLRIINEPTAAAISYGLQNERDHTVLVWDLGGGTFDVSVLHIQDGVFKVLATTGDNHLGGDDWDNALAKYLRHQFETENELSLEEENLALHRLVDSAEKAKIELSSLETTEINLPFLHVSEDETAYHFNTKITRKEFEAITASLRERMVQPTWQALSDAGLTPENVDEVLLIGGSTKTPSVRIMAEEIMKKPAISGINPDLAVAMGAALQGGILSGDVTNMSLLDVTPLSLGVEMANGGFARIIERNSQVPYSASRTFTTSKDDQTGVTINLIQGERDLAAMNKKLESFTLEGVRKAKRGLPRIDVIFHLDEEGILNITAKDQITKAENSISVIANSGLTDNDVERMIKEAEEMANTDKSIIESLLVHKDAENTLKEANRTLKLYKDRLNHTSKQHIISKTSILRYNLNNGDSMQIKLAIKDLEGEIVRVIGAMDTQSAGLTTTITASKEEELLAKQEEEAQQSEADALLASLPEYVAASGK